MDIALKQILSRVQKPGRYVGGEYGEICKDPKDVKLRIALCFPDTYEIGMSNLGVRILYAAWNAMDGVWCERCFAPWSDMERELRSEKLPLFTLESGESLRNFDLVAFSLGYEMSYTNVLNVLDLAGIPLRKEDRDESMPLIAAGGTCCYNPEPMADFIDVFLIGEGEKMNCELASLLIEAKTNHTPRREVLRQSARIEGVYVPELYQVDYHEDGTIASVVPLDGAPKVVRKRIVEKLDEAPFPSETIVPNTDIVHDRVMLEVFRGCIRGCRFCQAGYVYRPVRAKSPELLNEQARKAIAFSGYEEMTLSSLSTSDYKKLPELCDALLDWCEPMNVSLSLPSLRADNFSMALMERVQKVRKSGLTFAPEAGSQRLRDVINKNVRAEELLTSCRVAFEGGWSSIKLYFMLGLPTETDEDVLAIADLVGRVAHEWKEHSTNKNRGIKITVSTAFFVPKPDTPFQWEAQISREEYRRRVQLLKTAMRTRCVSYSWHDDKTSYAEAVLARGDRRLGRVIEAVWKNGGRLEAWDEYFDLTRWTDALRECDLDGDFYACRVRNETEILPWDHISCGVTKSHFLRERHEAYAERVTPDCRKHCSGCGAASLLKEAGCDD